MSAQFTAHSKLDHSSGVLFRPGTCYFSPSLFEKKKFPNKKAIEQVAGVDLRSKLQHEGWEERKAIEEEVQSNGEAVLSAQACSSELHSSLSPHLISGATKIPAQQLAY